MRPGLIFWLIVALVISGAVFLRALDPEPVARLRYLVFDTFIKASPRRYDPTLPVRIINIDDEALSRIGQWPWPRTVLAELTDRLRDNGAAVVGFDMLFSEPDRMSPLEIARQWPALFADPKMKAAISQIPPNDRGFATSIGEMRVVLGFSGIDRGRAMPPQKAKFAIAGSDPTRFVPAYSAASAGLAELESAATGLGSLSWIPESDQIVRRVPLVIRSGEALFPAFSLEVLRVVFGQRTLLIRAAGASGMLSFGENTGISSIRVGQIVVPTDASGRLWLNLTPSDKRRFISAAELLAGKVPRSEIDGRIILVGVNAAGLLDLRSTAIEASVPGVEVHAQAIEQMLTGNHLLRPDFIAGAEIFYLVAVGLLVAFIIYRAGAAWGAALGALSLVSVGAASWIAFSRLHWLVDPVYPSLAVTLLYIAGTVYLYWRTETDRRRIRSAFGFYMAPAFVEELARRPEKLKLGGEMREMTLMFLDVRGFTSLAEGLDAEAVTRFVNRLMTPLSTAILEERGTIDKYMGDAIMAFWNAPLDDPDHVRHAARAALGAIDRLDELNRRLVTEFKSSSTDERPIRIGIGLNTGICCVGNLGSELRFDYSVIGDNVNVASRLEELTKDYGLPIIVGEATAAAVTDMALIEIDRISLRGKTQVSTIYALLGNEDYRAGARFQRLLIQHQALLGEMRAGRIAAALSALPQCRKTGGDELAALYDFYEARLAGQLREAPDAATPPLVEARPTAAAQEA